MTEFFEINWSVSIIVLIFSTFTTFFFIENISNLRTEIIRIYSQFPIRLLPFCNSVLIFLYYYEFQQLYLS